MAFEKPRKQPKAAWTRAFPAQQKALHPGRGRMAGLMGRSATTAMLMAVYNAVRALFILKEPLCQLCQMRGHAASNWAEDVHHTRGRDGLLLLDVRWFLSACRPCHDWAHANPKDAEAAGITDLKNWGREAA